MTEIDQTSASNDYPVARMLNRMVLSIVASVRKAEDYYLHEDYEIDELNRAYVLLVDELENLYSQNSKLAATRPKPFWKRFDTLKNFSWQILDYLNDPVNDKEQAHIIRLDRLCIIAHNEAPKLSSEQTKLIDYASKAIENYRQILDESRLDYNAKIEDSWYIPEYKLEHKPNGTIVVNGVLQLTKTQIGSAIDQLLEQAYKNQNTLFVPTLPQTARNLSTLLSSAGFTPVLRQLFFPTISKAEGILFRPVVSYVQASKDNIDTTTLDLLLKGLDAYHTFSA